jgi:dienelactone hydrolase
LKAPDQVALRYRPGLHGTQAEDIESYLDFFDYVFKRSSFHPKSELLYPYSYTDWQKRATSTLAPTPLVSISKTDTTSSRRDQITQRLEWLLGEKPASVTNLGPQSLKKSGSGEDYFGNVLHRPKSDDAIGLMKITPYHGFGDYLYANLYYPKNTVAAGQKVPVVIYLHENDYSKGYSDIGHQHELQSFVKSVVQKGYAVMCYDMTGFGNRIGEAQRFYQRYPNWSKLGKMVHDTKGAVDALTHLDIIDPNQIYIAGYSLGGTVGLMTAALDTRVKGIAAISGVYPLRFGKSKEHTIEMWSKRNGFLPRLGLFETNPQAIPVDFEHILEAIAPRKVMLLTPQIDWTADAQAVQKQVHQVSKIYKAYTTPSNLQSYFPDDYSHFMNKNRVILLEWLEEMKNK